MVRDGANGNPECAKELASARGAGSGWRSFVSPKEVTNKLAELHELENSDGLR